MEDHSEIFANTTERDKMTDIWEIAAKYPDLQIVTIEKREHIYSAKAGRCFRCGRKYEENISVHKPPDKSKESERRASWVKNLGNERLHDIDFLVCSANFSEKQFNPSFLMRKQLMGSEKFKPYHALLPSAVPDVPNGCLYRKMDVIYEELVPAAAKSRDSSEASAHNDGKINGLYWHSIKIKII
ncbi:uncharacterized protein LOC132192712 [Neocloeon triangulifer]|uniref:uncharacterized protein LOC132192712 n=1 Tax=Neocloeon triangulifer TaxID=2078957 RepID=UPI00286EFECA|nr:uncharacterized protein LOC132192712 [Neocloeon triangulifer]XP_059468779.1 uncharacterized protein LOC132192712 [Neocloeon triangulifer]